MKQPTTTTAPKRRGDSRRHRGNIVSCQPRANALALTLCSLIVLTVMPQNVTAQQIDEVSQQATSLEGRLGKYRDTSPEAGEILIELTDLYYDSGRLFGLIRSGQRFVSAHSSHPKHAEIMLKLLDGLEALSRNREFTTIARQFLSKYPQAKQCADIEERLAYTLAKLGEKEAAANAYESRWKRDRNPNGRRFGVEACKLFSQTGNAGIEREAALAADMFTHLPKDDYGAELALRSFSQYRRIRKWAEANTAGTQLLKSEAIRKDESKRDVLIQLAENYHYLGQHSNAVKLLEQARQIRDDQKSHFDQIQRMYDAAMPAKAMEPVVKEYFGRYKDREDRYDRIALLAVAHEREKNFDKALPLFRTLLSVAPRAQDAAGHFVRLNAATDKDSIDTENALLEAIDANPKDVWSLRYHLGFSVYRDRMKNEAKSRQILRQMIEQSPTNDGHTSSVISWLLSNPDESEFRSDVARIIKARREYPHWTNLRGYLFNWAKNIRRDKRLKDRSNYVQSELAKADKDPVMALMSQTRRGSNDSRDARARAQLIASKEFASLRPETQEEVLSSHAYYLQHYSPRDQRGDAAAFWQRLVKMVPDNHDYAFRWLQSASDYGPVEVAVEAAKSYIAREPSAASSDAWRRLAEISEKAEDVGLLKRSFDFVRKAHSLHGESYQYWTRLGEAYRKLNREDDAIAMWREGAQQTANVREAADSAWRLAENIKDPQQQVRFFSDFLSRHDDADARVLLWLANAQIRNGDLDGYEKTLKKVGAMVDASPFASTALDVWALHYSFHNYRTSHQDYRQNAEQENSNENVLRVARAVAALRSDWPSAQAELLLLQNEPADARTPVERALAWQRVTRWVYPDSHRWDQLMPFAQQAITEKDYSIAATLLTGMLENMTSVNDTRRERGRSMIGQCYTRLGTVGLTIDENSPIAPLLQAALYLRLGDENLALEAYLANKALFDRHRDEVPADLLIFVCESLLAAGGDENYTKVEDTLRGWIIKNSEAATVDEELKAEIQFLLARNFYVSKRYDVARSEYTTVINRYPGTKFATEAEFGIGETFMAQKVYDQAELVFEKLSNSREPEIIVRAEFLRGVLSHRRGDNDEARAIFRNVLERVPNVELANQALFSLSEVYGDEERYIDQLQLLMTVGRLGRVSKRQHAPGRSLSIVVQDSDLGISRGHNRVPVFVRTEPGGDEELIFLTSGGAGKGVFRADVNTELGAASKNDKVLQVTGNDTIRCDYPDEFKSEFKSVPLSDVEIRIASDADFEVASSRIIDKEEETFSQRLEREARERRMAIASQQSDRRPTNQIKPGNPIYLRVKDADRDLGGELDTIVAKLVADSGDQVQVKLTETEPHSGIFEGTSKTGELPAGALASDTAIDHSPLMAIDNDRETYWQSEPDGTTPKSLTVDMKDLCEVSKATFFVPQSETNKPVRATLEASYDGEFWYRVGSHPAIPEAAPVEGEIGRMSYRLYDAVATSFSNWSQVVSLSRTQPIETGEVDDGLLLWERRQGESSGKRGNRKDYRAIIWSGKFVQPRSGAVRFQASGSRTAISVNGRLELPVGPGNRSCDVWLNEGTHELTIFAAGAWNARQLVATRVRADLNSSSVRLAPFLSSDFDLDQPAAEKSAPAASEAEVTLSDDAWDFAFSPINVRYTRFVIHEYLGEAIAVNHVEVSGPDETKYIPTEADVLALSDNEVLEIAGGDVVTASYTDDVTQTSGGNSRLLTDKLQATYFDASVSPIAYNFVRQDNGNVETIRKQLKRVEPGERIVVEITDYDRDQSSAPDQVQFEIVVNDGDPITLTATETEEYSGIFTKEVDTSASAEEDKLVVQRGDRVYIRYLDEQNTFPGHAVPRETMVYVNEPTDAIVRILETRVNTGTDGRRAPRTRFAYQPPPEGATSSSVAFEAPLTIEVIDPDAARDSLSEITVGIETSDGAVVDVRCVVSGAFTRLRNENAMNWALEEGRFIGQVILQLGSSTSPDIVPVTQDMPRDLIGGGKLPDEEDGEASLDNGLVARVLNLTGKDRIMATYEDEFRTDEKPAPVSAQGRLISNGLLAITDRDYDKPATQLHVGEKLFLMITDPDQDASDERDVTEVEISTELGEKETVQLVETLVHSGVFTGSFVLRSREEPKPGNFDATDPEIECYFGDTVRVRYVDAAASTESGELELLEEVPVVIGTDGLVAAFSKTFNDEELAVETKFHIAESYFELFKSHRELGRNDEEKTDLAAGRRILREVMEDYPDPKYVPRIAYLFGQFAQELESWAEATESYAMIVRQFPEHPLAADAQYKLAQSYEEAGDFDEALEAYVTLAATYPKSPLIASVMIRISDHFYKAEEFDVAAQVGEKFLDRFEGHQHAARIAFRVGQCAYKGEKFNDAGDAFDRFNKLFPDDELAADALFWSGESFRKANDNREAFRRYNRCRWDFPESEAAKYSRGRLALPEMLQQFEAEARSVEDQ